MLEPQGTAFFLLLMVGFAALVLWAALVKQVVFRVLAGCLAFLPAMVFGIAAVNKYYDYYQTWGSMFSDLTNSSTATYPKFAAAGLATGTDIERVLQQESAQGKLAGYTISLTVTGPVSHITRTVLVYLPPQYFMPRYKHYRFPAIELLHGSPGDPAQWINVMNVIPTYLALLDAHKAQPAVLVMPDTDGGERYGLQCLNDPGGLQDMTFVAQEVPDAITRLLRVMPAGLSWGIAGYSEGGYCAANIGLQYPYKFGFVGVMSGYFAPIDSQVPLGNKPGGKPVQINDFKGHPALVLRNTPEEYIVRMSPSIAIPQFFLAAGLSDPQDVSAATTFRYLLETRQTNVPLDLVAGGGHNAKVWRAALTPMLKWMTPQLSEAVTNYAKVAQERERELREHHLKKPALPRTVRRRR